MEVRDKGRGLPVGSKGTNLGVGVKSVDRQTYTVIIKWTAIP
jgi:hypothetical protein